MLPLLPATCYRPDMHSAIVIQLLALVFCFDFFRSAGPSPCALHSIHRINPLLANSKKITFQLLPINDEYFLGLPVRSATIEFASKYRIRVYKECASRREPATARSLPAVVRAQHFCADVFVQ